VPLQNYDDFIFYYCFFLFLTSAIIEHTNQVIYLEDNDVAAVNRLGQLTIHRIRHSYDDPHASAVREVHTLRMEIQQIMKGLRPDRNCRNYNCDIMIIISWCPRLLESPGFFS